MKRRDFLKQSSAALAAGGPLVHLAGWTPAASPWLLIPMDDTQTDHLKAYGVTFRVLERGDRCEWFLNYRDGAFLVPGDAATMRDAQLSGVRVESVDESALLRIRADLATGNMEAVPLEKAPEIAVYAPPDAAPWDDAVTMALQYAGITFQSIWDGDVLGPGLTDYDWVHLHHEDFTGQYSKFFLNYSGSAWLNSMVSLNESMARSLGYPDVPSLKRAVAERIRAFVMDGGFLFAMCTATETLDLTLAGASVDLAANYADGDPMDPNASSKMDWSRSLAFRDAELVLSPTVPQFSDIDGHQVNAPARRQSLGSYTLFSFSAKIDPVATMLVQNHREVIPDFYGLTTSFNRHTIKPGVTILADEPGSRWVKYIHGEAGEGTWTFFGGHDPEDPQHQIGDAPTDLSLHPHSPGYRLILNNVLFPAAKKKELKT